MAKERGRIKRPADASSAQVERAKSEVESFGQKWGMKLTEQETNIVIERALDKVREVEGEIKIRPALRNEMFALLVEKNPAKAISFRIDAHRKRGGKIGGKQEDIIIAIAKQGGFREANAQLRFILREQKRKRKPGGKIEQFGALIKPSKKKKVPKFIRVFNIPPIKKKEVEVAHSKPEKEIPKYYEVVRSSPQKVVEKIAVTPVEKKEVGELQARGKRGMELAYNRAMQKNKELGGVVSECKLELRLLEEKYYGKNGKMKGAGEKKGEVLLAEYRKLSRGIQGKYKVKANELKKKRDSYAKAYIRAGTLSMVGEEKMEGAAAKGFVVEQTKKMVEFGGATSMGSDYGVKAFKKSDLEIRGTAAQNVANFKVQMKKWEEGRKKRAMG